jgi:hypothetical protein
MAFFPNFRNQMIRPQGRFTPMQGGIRGLFGGSPFMGGGFNPYQQQRMPFMGGGFNPYQQQRMPFMGGGFNPYQQQRMPYQQQRMPYQQQRMPFMGGFNPYQQQRMPFMGAPAQDVAAPPSINDLFSGLDADARANFFNRFGLVTKPPGSQEYQAAVNEQPNYIPPPAVLPLPPVVAELERRNINKLPSVGGWSGVATEPPPPAVLPMATTTAPLPPLPPVVAELERRNINKLPSVGGWSGVATEPPPTPTPIPDLRLPTPTPIPEPVDPSLYSNQFMGEVAPRPKTLRRGIGAIPRTGIRGRGGRGGR